MITLKLTDEENDTLLIMLGMATGEAETISASLAEKCLHVSNAILLQVGGTPYESLQHLRAKVEFNFPVANSKKVQ